MKALYFSRIPKLELIVWQCGRSEETIYRMPAVLVSYVRYKDKRMGRTNFAWHVSGTHREFLYQRSWSRQIVPGLR